MADLSPELIAKLIAFKQQDLTFYQATERLKQQGYSSAQITEAADRFNYTNPEIDTDSDDELSGQETKTDTPASPPPDSEIGRDYQKLGNALLADKERSTRPYVYVGLAVPAGYLGQQIYGFYLSRRFWGSHGDPQYWWANNLGFLILSGAIGAGIAILGLKLYFHSKDNKYKQIEKDLSDDSNSQ